MSQVSAKNRTTTQDDVWIELNQTHLIHNLNTLKAKSREDIQVMAIIKANAYGHGLIEIAQMLQNEVTYLAVSSLREALEVRSHGIETPLFMLGRLLDKELETAVRAGLTLSVSSLEEAEQISEISENLSTETKIHIKVDTGMGRLGMPFRNAIPLIQKIEALPALIMEGLYTHLPSAERNDGFSEKQMKDFTLLVEALRQKGIVFRYRHATNSAGTLKFQHPALNMIRPGLMLYGVFPHASLKEFATLKPVLSLKARVTFVKYLKPGESVGYGREFIADDLTTIAILPLGYSHGYPFRASGKAHVLAADACFKVAGRVSMDFIAVDFGNQVIHPKTEVTLIGQTNHHTVSVEHLADWAETLPYEILTHLLPTIKRYIRQA